MRLPAGQVGKQIVVAGPPTQETWVEWVKAGHCSNCRVPPANPSAHRKQLRVSTGQLIKGVVCLNQPKTGEQ